MATTTNFGWETPDDTDLVKDGAAAMRTLGNAIDTSMVDLKGGTTNQVLAKASNTDMDFSWVAAGLSASIVDAKGDLIAATAADTVSRLAVGTNGQYLSADSAEATGLKWVTPTSGSLTLLSTTSLSGTSTTISSISGSYKNLLIYLDDWTLNANVKLDIRIDSNSSAGFYQENRLGTTAYSKNSTTEARPNSDANAATGSQSNKTMLYIYDYASSTTYKNYQMITFYMDSTPTKQNESVLGTWTSTSAVDSLIIRSSNGTATIGGSVRIYGVN
jgi:hypothetical protein